MSEYDDWKQENDRWEAYLYPNGVLRNKLGITKAAKWHKMERDFVTARNTDLRPNTGLTTGNVGEELFAGTTSACAENTVLPVLGFFCRWNYLRVRGEYAWALRFPTRRGELPPRARRILNKIFLRGRPLGTTSACAENTQTETGKRLWGEELPPRARRIPTMILSSALTNWNYLCVRGEYLSMVHFTFASSELPPRARRIHGCGCQ